MEWTAAVALVIMLAAVTFVIYRARRSRVDGPPPRGPSSTSSRTLDTEPGTRTRGAREAEDEFGVLLTMVLGDRRKAEWLISYEAGKEPRADRARHIRNAIARLRDDLRR
jgi:hypothetical protein